MRWILILCLILSIQILEGTLSASDRKKKEPKQKQPKKVDEFKKRFEVDKTTYDELTSFNDKSYKFDDTTERTVLNGPSLAFITPWNTAGYSNTLKAANKLTHVAPVWFHIAEPDDDGAPCMIDGINNIRRDWMDDIRKKNPDIKIVPRFLFDGWKSHAKIENFFMNEDVPFQCGQLIVDFIRRNEFDGGVIELYVQLMTFTGGKGEMLIIEILQQWNLLLKNAKKEVIVPLFPPRPNEGGRAMNPEVLRQFVENADMVMLMTYDHNSPTVVGVAPINWIDMNIQYALDSIEGLDTKKILLGLNFYGYFYKQGRPEAGLINNFVDKLTKDKTVQLYWDKISEEHALVEEGTRNIVGYFPSKKSIQARVELANRYDIGIGIWEAGQAPLYYFEPL